MASTQHLILNARQPQDGVAAGGEGRCLKLRTTGARAAKSVGSLSAARTNWPGTAPTNPPSGLHYLPTGSSRSQANGTGLAGQRTIDRDYDAGRSSQIRRRFDRGEDILVAGSTTTFGYRLHEGWAATYAILADGRRQLIYLYVPGDNVVMPSRKPGRADYCLTAITKVVLDVLSPTAMEAAAISDSQMLSNWLASLLKERLILSERIVSLGRRSAYERTAQLLAELCIRLDPGNWREKTRVQLPVTQEMLADLLGLSVVHVNRTLRRLREKNMLNTKQGCVEIYDPGHLADTAEIEADSPLLAYREPLWGAG